MPPNAVATCPATGTVGTAVTFDGTGSSDDGGISAYAWDFGDGSSGHRRHRAAHLRGGRLVHGDAHRHRRSEPDRHGAACTITIQTADTTGPSISHTPASGPLAAGQSLTVTASVTDASGIQAARLHWRTKGQAAFHRDGDDGRR